MKTLRAQWLHITSALLLLAVSLFSGAITTSAQSHHDMHDTRMAQITKCQSVCSSMTSVVPVITKRDEEEQDKDTNYFEFQWPAISPFQFEFVQKITSTFDAIRLLRPPDIFALYSVYRI